MTYRSIGRSMMPVSEESARSLAPEDPLEATVSAFLAHRADTRRELERALAVDPGSVELLCLRGFAVMSLGRRRLHDVARTAHRLASQSLASRPRSVRARAMHDALGAWCDADPIGATAHLDAGLWAAPTDVLLLKLAHGLRFMTGDARGMRASVEGVLSAYPADHPAKGYVHGMYAFALEETGDLTAAEEHGHLALSLAPDDIWAAHAIVHVHAMRDATSRGLTWIDSLAPMLARTNNFGAHIEMHRALFHIARGEPEVALAIHDSRIATEPDTDYRDIANAASLLFRATSAGCPVGDRWQRLADIAATRLGDHGLAFADVHYVLALLRAKRHETARAFVESLRAEAATSTGHDAAIARDVGLPLIDAMVIAEHDAEQGYARLVSDTPSLSSLGGSHVQRDLFTRIIADMARAASLARVA